MGKFSSLMNRVLNPLGYNLAITTHFNSKTWFDDRQFKTIIDIGANEGQFLEKILKSTPNANYICFEPLHDAFSILKKNTANLKNVKIVNCALGNEKGKLEIYKNNYSASSSLLKMNSKHKDTFEFTKQETKEEIVINKLDNWMIENSIKLQSPLLIKIDVQGYEKNVMLGGLNTIRNASYLLLEVSFVQLYDNAPFFDEIYTFLKDLGFAYVGSLEHLEDPQTKEILQADALFKNLNV